ncbi:hypothetical protein HAALTHF_39340n [Vreelandella aquamarina]|nr:hypothetical protein HAALTHF_39340n [Halomonas axialensis]
MGEAASEDTVAYIREAECIGCTKCIQACPVDAIIGAAKQMHTVIEDECTGCDLCVAPLPGGLHRHAAQTQTADTVGAHRERPPAIKERACRPMNSPVASTHPNVKSALIKRRCANAAAKGGHATAVATYR